MSGWPYHFLLKAIININNDSWYEPNKRSLHCTDNWSKSAIQNQLKISNSLGMYPRSRRTASERHKTEQSFIVSLALIQVNLLYYPEYEFEPFSAISQWGIGRGYAGFSRASKIDLPAMRPGAIGSSRERLAELPGAVKLARRASVCVYTRRRCTNSVLNRFHSAIAEFTVHTSFESCESSNLDDTVSHARVYIDTDACVIVTWAHTRACHEQRLEAVSYARECTLGERMGGELAARTGFSAEPFPPLAAYIYRRTSEGVNTSTQNVHYFIKLWSLPTVPWTANLPTTPTLRSRESPPRKPFDDLVSSPISWIRRGMGG